MHSSMFSLPEIRKKVIYIDQFAISNMMKSLNQEASAHHKGIDDFWLKLFERLDSLSKLQLIICPMSQFHVQESVVDKHRDALKKMYELLGHGISFHQAFKIKVSQLREHARRWLHGREDELLSFDVTQVIDGNANGWSDVIFITLNYSEEETKKWAEGLREIREKSIDETQPLMARWQSEKDRTFEYWHEQEAMSWGTNILDMVANQDKRLEGWIPPAFYHAGQDVASPLVAAVSELFIEEGVLNSQILQKTREYFLSSATMNIPFNNISAMIWAAIARQFALGRKKPVSAGIYNDVGFVSVLLPYCDAMFVDNEMHTLLSQKPLADKLNYNANIFSLNHKEDFLTYLDQIEANAPSEHIALVEFLYGAEGIKPYTALYK